MPGYADVETSADGESEGCVVTGWLFAYGSGEVTVKPVNAPEQPLPEGLEASVSGTRIRKPLMP